MSFLTASGTPSEASSAAKQSARVDLDVGGTIFHTRVSTLTGGSSFFKAILSSTYGDTTISSDGTYKCFVDQDPAIFAHILTHLRTDRMPLFWTQSAGFDLALYANLLGQARFFQLDALVNWIDNGGYRKAVTISSRIQIEDDTSYVSGAKALPVARGNTWVKIDHVWETGKRFVCARGIAVHDAPEKCGRQCSVIPGRQSG